MLEWRSHVWGREPTAPAEGLQPLSRGTRPLVEGAEARGRRACEEQVAAFGRGARRRAARVGTARERAPAEAAHARPLRRADRRDRVSSGLGPAARLGLEHGLQSLPWVDERPGAHVARAALFMLLGAGRGRRRLPAHDDVRRRAGAAGTSPTSRTSGSRALTSGATALCGMAMTERQGGSDVRANETTARRDGDAWLPRRAQVVLLGADVRRVPRARAGARRALLLPRRAARRPGFRIERLKDKLGNRSNASAEIALDGVAAGSSARRDAACATILEMVIHTRLDCVLGSAALMRRAVAEATHHAAHRSAFGRLLAEQPLMRNVLADLCVESEAATATALRLARAFDEADDAVPAARDRGREVLGLQAHARRSSPRRWSASAATATSRSRSCRGSSARARSTRSGKAPAT